MLNACDQKHWAQNKGPNERNDEQNQLTFNIWWQLILSKNVIQLIDESCWLNTDFYYNINCNKSLYNIYCMKRL